MSEYVKLGSISGYYGVKGWLKLFSHTRPRVGISEYKNFYLGDTKSKIEFAEIKERSKHMIGYIDNVDSRESAESFVGKNLYILQSDLPALNKEYYWHELVDLKVSSHTGIELGKIKEMIETGVHDVMVINGIDGDEILIPYVMGRFVLSIDLDEKLIIVDWE